MPVYKWRSDIGFKSVDPQAAGERLEALRVKCEGALTPEAVVTDARKKASPLHGCFEWDDTKAAERYRLSQAGDVIRSVVVTVEAPLPNEKPRSTRAFVHVETETGPHYTSLAHAMSEPDLRKQVLQRAFTELQGWRTRYREYEELAAIFGAMDKVAKKIVG